MTPLLAIAYGFFHMAYEAAKRLGSIGAFAICVATLGACFAGLWFYLLWYFASWLPGVTVTRFALIDEKLTLHTTKWRELTLKVSDVTRCRTNRGKNQVLRGWWIKLRSQGWVYLPKENTYGAELANHLQCRLEKDLPS
jgi:hypothetical protein